MKILLIDGNSILNRAFYGVAPLTASDGTPTGAVFGFINILKRHLDLVAPDIAVCAFDLPGKNFRHELYSEYKANRSGMPEDLAVQLPIAKDVVGALGLRVAEAAGFEADDVLGTLATEAAARGDDAYILTGDRDSLQLIGDRISVVLVKNKGDILFDRPRFIEEYGVTPEQFIDVKALMGDSSDNIPGVRGIGEKTALKLISAAGDIDTLYADPAAYGAKGATLQKLCDGRDMAYLSKTLATIDRDIPVLDRNLLFTKAEPDNAKLSALFERLEFSNLRHKFGLDNEKPAPAPMVEVPAMQMTDVLPADLAESLADAEVLSVILTADGDSHELQVAFGETVMRCVFSDAEQKTVADALLSHPLNCYDFKNFTKYFIPSGAKFECVFDPMLAAYLLSPGEGAYPLDRVSQKYISSNAPQAYKVKLLSDVLLPMLSEAGMESLLRNIEIPLSRVLAGMEYTGFAVDGDGIHNYMLSLKSAADALCEQIYFKAGERFNLNSPKQLGEILFEKLGLPSGRKTKTGYSTDAETLERLRPYDDIVGDILDYRQLSKLCGTYGDSLVALSAADGRIHTVFNQTGTATGRLSSSDPNMQNIPVRESLGREIRKYFTASAPGRVLVDGDYSQIELRLLAEMSGDAAMQKAFIDGEDIHRRTASQVFGVPFESVTPELRSRAKAVNFGIVYGIGAFSLARDLHISRKMADEYIRSYLATYSDVDRFLTESIASARKLGYAVTMFGRRRYIPELSSRNKNLQAFGERVAMNSPVQGSAADLIKLAMIGVDRALREANLDAKLILQVHDELIIDAAEDAAEEAAAILRREMENAAVTTVPMAVDISTGYSWYDAK